MILAAIVAGLSACAGLLLAGGILYYVAKRKIRAIFRNFTSVTASGGASPLACLCSLVGGVFASEIAGSLKATFMGIESVAAKSGRRAAGQSALAGAVASSPLLAALVASFPAVGKKLSSNPALAGLAGAVLDKVSSGRPGGNGSSGEAVKFNL